jgi:small subunit ribosomal protein S4
MEKQQAKYTYGVLERQFRTMFENAAHKTGVTGEVLMQMLESRLDNTVFRLGIAPSRRAARQLVNHKHIEVNGKVVGIPSFHLRPGDVVSVRERSKALEAILDSLDKKGTSFPWLEWDANSMSGKFLEMPEREKIPETIKEQLIVELYSK